MSKLYIAPTRNFQQQDRTVCSSNPPDANPKINSKLSTIAHIKKQSNHYNKTLAFPITKSRIKTMQAPIPQSNTFKPLEPSKKECHESQAHKLPQHNPDLNYSTLHRQEYSVLRHAYHLLAC